jgi:hypothetical protein
MYEVMRQECFVEDASKVEEDAWRKMVAWLLSGLK